MDFAYWMQRPSCQCTLFKIELAWEGIAFIIDSSTQRGSLSVFVGNMSSQAYQWSKGWLDAFLAFLYPENCQICQSQRAKADEGYVCEECRRQIAWIEPPFCLRCGLPYEGEITTPFNCANCRDFTFYFQSARSAVVARGIALDIIHRYKYSRALWFEPLLAGLLVRKAQPALNDGPWHRIVPVPLHSTKLREREFNQAERLAAALSAATGIPLDPHVLKRVKATQTQTELSREERQSNIRNAFAPAGHCDLSGQRIVLIDDVFTTGATTNACARVLSRMGADEICVWTLARGLSGHSNN